MPKYFHITQKRSILRQISKCLSKGKGIHIPIILFLLSVCLMLLDYRNLQFLHEIRSRIASAVVYTSILPKIQLKMLSSPLNRKIDTHNTDAASIAFYKSENKFLKSLLNFVESKNIKVVTSVIVGDIKEKIFFGAYHSEVKPNQIVINDIGIVGKVVAVEKNYFIGLLVTHPHFRIPVVSANTMHRFVLSGLGNGSKLSASYLEGELQDGELIFSTLTASRIPVASFDAKTASIKPLFDERRIDIISVVRDE